MIHLIHKDKSVNHVSRIDYLTRISLAVKKELVIELYQLFSIEANTAML